LKEYIGRILLSEDVILERVRELGQQISKDYRGKEIIILCVLKGAVVFLADLLRNLDIPADLDFIQISSYGNETESLGEVRISQGLTTNIEGRHVLIVEDIVDSGLTLSRLKEILLAERPASLRFCVLLDKDRTGDVKLDYVGFKIPADEFVIGYGLDYAGKYRGLRYVATLEI
jgi:hypoxanthine phosphoribosyltransferase